MQVFGNMQQGERADQASASKVEGRCADCAVRDRAVCSTLSADSLSDLRKIGRSRTLPKGQALAWEGDDASLIVNVRSGMLKLSSSARNGSEQILGLIGPGGFAGRPQGGAMQQNIVALVDTEICVFPRDNFDRFAELHPEIRATLLDRSIEELDHLRRWMLLLARGSALERVATLLVDFAGEGNGPHPLPLSRGQIAEFTGLTIETVSRQFTKIKSSGIIALPTRDSFEVIDRDALCAIAGVHPVHPMH